MSKGETGPEADSGREDKRLRGISPDDLPGLPITRFRSCFLTYDPASSETVRPRRDLQAVMIRWSL